MILRAIAKFSIIFIWLFLSSYHPLLACDTGDFVFEEFGIRCQNMGNMLKTLLATQKMQMPNQIKARSAMANEWVSFYLSHGKEAPASFTRVLPDAWANSMNYVGQQITALIFEKLPPEQADSACVVFDLVAVENNMLAAHAAMAEWHQVLKQPPGETIASVTEWLGYNLNAYLFLTSVIAQNYSNLVKNTETFVNHIKMQWLEVLKAPQTVQESLIRFTAPRLIDKIKTEYALYKLITLYQEP